MARKSGTTATPDPAPTASDPTAPTKPSGPSGPRITIPAPPGNLAKLIRTVTWPKSRIIHRIHKDIYKANQFNPGPHGNARFSAIVDAKGNQIPTIYGGETFDCAAMETVFHDIPYAPGLKNHRKRELRGHEYSQVLSTTDLTLVDLSTIALRNLGIKRSELIETEKDIYPQTRLWAEAFHARCPDIQGLCWISRQDDRALAVILFGDRLGADPLTASTPSLNIVDDASTYADVIKLAGLIGVKITGK